MGCQQVSVLMGILTALVLVNAQTPKPCCNPNFYSAGLAALTSTSQPEQLVSQEGMYYFDGPNKRTAVNITVRIEDGQPPVQQVYQIQDFGKKMMYTIVDNKTCTKTPLPGDFPGTNCIPDDAKFRGTIKLGESYAVNRWYIKTQNGKQEITMTVDKCIPVTSVITAPEVGITLASQEFFNFKTSIDHPDEKFTPPSFCNATLNIGPDVNRFKWSPPVTGSLFTLGIRRG